MRVKDLESRVPAEVKAAPVAAASTPPAAAREPIPPAAVPEPDASALKEPVPAPRSAIDWERFMGVQLDGSNLRLM